MTERTTRAQIVATIGPSTWSEELIHSMIEQGLDVVRLNFSWGSYEEFRHYIHAVRAAAESLARQIPIIQDLSGPREQGTDGHEFDSSKAVLTEKDLKDLDFGIEQHVDYIALSYVGTAHDVELLRSEIRARRASTRIIAKIERKVALENLDGIIEAADAIMVARGDLGNEVTLEEIPFVEREIIAKSKKAGKPVIVATQMLLSMKDHNSPTRAEMTDVVFAIENGADAVMLSEETASGLYPLQAVEFMDRAIAAAEAHGSNQNLNPLVMQV